MPKGIEKEPHAGGRKETFVLPDMAHLVEGEISSLGGKEAAAGAKKGRSRKLGAAGLALVTLLASAGEAGAQSKFIWQDLGRQLGNRAINSVFNDLGRQQQLMDERARRRQQLGDDAIRTQMQRQDRLDDARMRLNEDLIRQYRQEYKEAKTPEQVKFVNDKYKSMIQLPESSPPPGQWKK